LALDDVERGRELDVPDVIAAEVDVHEPRYELARVRVLVVLDALEEGVGAVAHADDRYAHTVVCVLRLAVLSVGRSHGVLSSSFARRQPEAFTQGVDDEIVCVAAPLRRPSLELRRELRRHTQKDVAALAGQGCLPARGLEWHSEPRREDSDRDVVEVRAGPRHFVAEAPLQFSGHADEDGLSTSTHVLAAEVSNYLPASSRRTWSTRCTTVIQAVAVSR